jgi:hypothetical protein
MARETRKLHIAALVIRTKPGWNDETWVKTVELTPHQAEFVRAVGLGEETVLTTTQALRVAARVTGSSV